MQRRTRTRGRGVRFPGLSLGLPPSLEGRFSNKRGGSQLWNRRCSGSPRSEQDYAGIPLLESWAPGAGSPVLTHLPG